MLRKVRGLAAALLLCAIFVALPVADAKAQAAAEVVRARGAWSASVNYVTDDLVTLRGSACKGVVLGAFCEPVRTHLRKPVRRVCSPRRILMVSGADWLGGRA